MRTNSKLSPLLFLILCISFADAQRTSIKVQDASGKTIAQASSSSKKGGATLRLDHEYQPGDRVIAHGTRWLTAHVSDALPDCSVYLSLDAHSTFTFEIPYGSGEQHTGSAYPVDGFAGSSHTLTVTPLSKHGRLTRRNLALNPCDMRTPSPLLFPHTSTNSVSRNA